MGDRQELLQGDLLPPRMRDPIHECTGAQIHFMLWTSAPEALETRARVRARTHRLQFDHAVAALKPVPNHGEHLDLQTKHEEVREVLQVTRVIAKRMDLNHQRLGVEEQDNLAMERVLRRSVFPPLDDPVRALGAHCKGVPKVHPQQSRKPTR